MSEKPTLFVLSNMREFGGAERSIAALLPRLAEEAKIHFYVENEPHRRDVEALRLPDLQIVQMPDGNSPAAMARSIFRLVRDFVCERPDALLANGHKGALLLALLRWALLGWRFRSVIYVRDFDYYMLPFLLRSLPRDLTLYAAPTQSIFDDKKYRAQGLLRQRCEVIPNAVPPPTQRDTRPVVEPFFACCARITPWKGIEYLIRAMALVTAENPAARLRIYGEVIDAEYYASLCALVAELSLEKAISFEPFTPDIGSVYAQGAFFVIPSLSIPPGPESFCRIIIESWSYAKPVIAFAAGGPKTLIRDGEDGFLVPERDVEMLAECIARLLREPKLTARLGAAGAGRVQSEFSPAILAGRLCDRLFPDPIPAPPVREPATA